MEDRKQAATREWRTWRHMLVGALSGVTVVASLATRWPLDLLPVAGLIAVLLLLARFRPRAMRDLLLRAGFVGGLLFITVAGLVRGGLTGQAWLSPTPSFGLQVLVLVLGVCTVLVPARRVP